MRMRGWEKGVESIFKVDGLLGELLGVDAFS